MFPNAKKKDWRLVSPSMEGNGLERTQGLALLSCPLYCLSF